jgi:5-oxoprolinase (ATP-hydrolysing)
MTRAILPAGKSVEEGLLAFDFGVAFVTKYQQEFGFLLNARSVLVDDIRVRGTFSPPSNTQKTPATLSSTPASPHASTPLYFEELKAWKDVPVYLHTEMLNTETVVPGPAIIMQNQATVVVESEWTAEILPNGDLYLYLSAPSSILSLAEQTRLDQVAAAAELPAVVMDPIQLSVFSHRFMGIAEQMGRTLARTSVSVNIKVSLYCLLPPMGSVCVCVH